MKTRQEKLFVAGKIGCAKRKDQLKAKFEKLIRIKTVTIAIMYTVQTLKMQSKYITHTVDLLMI